MKKIFIKILVISNILLLPAYAQFAVIDTAGHAQAITQVQRGYNQIKNMIEQAKTLKNQLEQQAKHLLAQAAYYYNLPNTIQAEVEAIQKEIEQLADIESTLAKFKDIDYYKSSPCFKPEGCTQEELNAIMNATNKDTLMSLSDAAQASLKLIQHYNDSNFNDNLEQIRERTKAAEGQLAATQNLAEYMDVTNQNIAALRSELRAFNQTFSTYMMHEVEKEKLANSIPFSVDAQPTEEFEIQMFD